MNVRPLLLRVSLASDLINGWLFRAGGIVVTLAVVMLVGLMIVPATPQVMDVLIGSNIALAVTILLVALYIQDANRLPSFPTILLVTTLFRLSLNVSSTRLILTDAEAGQIIDAFGEFVVGGNVVVGGVIFLIITLIQFIVITKGAERVAEVSARFTLDAMGGKQMAIDADLRANMISPEDAKARRRRLDRECKLYGAMDGAMKFVKGDAIAGIIISLINVVAGLIIGCAQMGMEPAEAAQRFTLLSIGDGLVSQFPALLISVAAGLVVTRVASDMRDDGQGDGYAGKEMLEQILGQPVALASVSAMLLLLATLPTGLPKPVFLALAGCIALVAVPQLPWFRPPTAAMAGAGAGMGAAGAPNTSAESAARSAAAMFPLPIRVSLENELYKRLTKQAADLREFLAGAARQSTAFDGLRGLMRSDMGLDVPEINLTPSALQPPDGYCIDVFDCSVQRGRFAPGDILIPCHEREARRLGFDVRPSIVPWNGAPACVASADDYETVKDAGLRPLKAEAVIVQHVFSTVRRHACEFLGVQDTQLLIEGLERALPDLKDAVVPKPLTVVQVTAVLRLLLREEVPIRNLRLIMETLAQIGTRMNQPLDLAEAVRRAMGREICHRYAGPGGVLRYFRFNSDIEQLIEDGREVDTDENAALVSLSGDARAAITAGVNHALQESWRSGHMPVVLTRADLRIFARSILVNTHPALPVISDLELASATLLRAEWMGEIGMGA